MFQLHCCIDIPGHSHYRKELFFLVRALLYIYIYNALSIWSTKYTKLNVHGWYFCIKYHLGWAEGSMGCHGNSACGLEWSQQRLHALRSKTNERGLFWQTRENSHLKWVYIGIFYSENHNILIPTCSLDSKLIQLNNLGYFERSLLDVNKFSNL